MVKACFICGAKDVRLFEIPSSMKQREKWFEPLETFCGKQIYADNDKDNLLICICNIKDTTKITDYTEICERHFQQDFIITTPKRRRLCKDAVPSIFVSIYSQNRLVVFLDT
jgi:hypothetical protein